uniref:interleukin-13 receptor subunit alpha-1 isoform X2 n=1 Tax=Scatophagus argus TaxID=75038 RepID=UPI001ED85C51|nr:interleukin-13 receptor subunit alpha-1 isoform X2 [Scatophagus argus]
MFGSLDLFAVSCFFVTTESLLGQILPPQNVSLLWYSDFKPVVDWSTYSMENCTYEVKRDDETDSVLPPWRPYVVMDGRFLSFSITTVCGDTRSQPAAFTFNYTELVRDLQCHIYSSKKTYCSWTLARPIEDLGFFYELVNEDGSTDIDDDSSSLLQACPSYTYTNGARTGCALQAKMTQDIHISFNGTWANQTVRNTFKIALKTNVRLPPLNWTVTKNRDKFLIRWDPPDIVDLSLWKFRINYTECNDMKFKDIYEQTSTDLPVVPHCPYRIAIKAQTRKLETPWSEKYFDAEPNDYYYLMVAIAVPLMFAVLTTMMFILWRRNQDYIFPKIPEPRNFLIDIPDNNNKSTVGKLYVPAEEEDNCKITLVKDPTNNNLYP